MQIKNAMSYHYTDIRMAAVKNITMPNSSEDTKKLEPPYMAVGYMKWYKHFGNGLEVTFLVFLFFKLNINLPYDPTIPFLGSYQREIKMNVHTKPPT